MKKLLLFWLLICLLIAFFTYGYPLDFLNFLTNLSSFDFPSFAIITGSFSEIGSSFSSWDILGGIRAIFNLLYGIITVPVDFFLIINDFLTLFQ